MITKTGRDEEDAMIRMLHHHLVLDAVIDLEDDGMIRTVRRLIQTDNQGMGELIASRTAPMVGGVDTNLQMRRIDQQRKGTDTTLPMKTASHGLVGKGMIQTQEKAQHKRGAIDMILPMKTDNNPMLNHDVMIPIRKMKHPK